MLLTDLPAQCTMLLALLCRSDPLQLGHTTNPSPPIPPTILRAQAIDSLMGGQEVLRVVCVGEGTTGGGLATLCGPWAALQYPKANVDVITFATPWVIGCSCGVVLRGMYDENWLGRLSPVCLCSGSTAAASHCTTQRQSAVIMAHQTNPANPRCSCYTGGAQSAVLMGL